MPFSISQEFLQTKKMIFSSIFDDFSFGQKNLIPQRKSLVRKMEDFYSDFSVLIIGIDSFDCKPFLCSTLKHIIRLVLEGMIFKLVLLLPKIYWLKRHFHFVCQLSISVKFSKFLGITQPKISEKNVDIYSHDQNTRCLINVLIWIPVFRSSDAWYYSTRHLERLFKFYCNIASVYLFMRYVSYFDCLLNYRIECKS